MYLDTYVATIARICALVQKDMSLYPHFRQIGVYKGLSKVISKTDK